MQTVNDLNVGDSFNIIVEETGRELRLIKMDPDNRFFCDFYIYVELSGSSRYPGSSARAYLNSPADIYEESYCRNREFFYIKETLSNYMERHQVVTTVPPGLINQAGKKYDITEDFVTLPSIADFENVQKLPYVKKENPSSNINQDIYYNGLMRTPSAPTRTYRRKANWQSRRMTTEYKGTSYVCPIIFLSANTPLKNGYFCEISENLSNDDFMNVLFA